MSSPVKTINILGVTGSVGGCAADVILSNPERFSVQAVTAHNNAEKLAALAIQLKAKHAVILQENKFSEVKELLSGTGIQAQAGQQALDEAAAMNADLTLAAIVGMAGLKPLLSAIRNSRCVAVANKEPLVAAGPLVMAEARKYKTTILPVDSEHNAVFQVFDFERPQGIERIILTASGGPFRTWPVEKMEKALPEQALAHPNWSMGPKISIDSATMMNKALEIIEAHYLFGLPPEKIEAVIHPQSVIHSMVEYKDGSVLAQMGASDMRTPVAHVLAWPDRIKTPGRRLDFETLKTLSFEPPDHGRFPALNLAYQALAEGPHACIALNAANEMAVDAYLKGAIGFLGITDCICRILEKVENVPLSTLPDILGFDGVVRQAALAYMNTGRIQKTVARQ